MRKLLILLIVLMSCGEKATNLPETSSEVLNKFIEPVSHQIIDLDKLHATEVFINEEKVFFNVNDQSSLFIGHIESAIMHNDMIYFYDLVSKAVYILDKKGNVYGPKTSEGRGPGEHNVISNLASNSSYIYMGDLNNARINRYTHEIEPLDPIPGFFPSMISVSDELLIYQNQESSGFSPSAPDQGRIGISPANNLNDTLKTIMPRIIPSGFQPQVFNHVYFSINNHNQIAASYMPIPWIFIFNKNHEIDKLLVFKYSKFEELDIPVMDLFKPQSNKGYGGQIPIHHYILMDNGDLFVTLRNEVIHLAPGNSGDYKVKKRFKINHDGDSESDIAESFLWTFNKVFYSHEQYALVFNPEYIYRLSLN